MSTDLTPTPAIGPGAPLPHHLRIVAERLSLVAESVAWDLPQVDGRPLQGAALRDWTSARYEKIAQHTTEFGLGLMMIKIEMGHGAWLGWLEEVGIPSRTAHDALQLARLVFAAPETAVPVLTALPRRKLQALAPGGQMLIEALTEDGTLAEVPEMSREEIRILVRERLETQRLRESLQDVAAQRDEAVGQLKAAAALPAVSRRLQALRSAALEEVEQARSTGLALTRLVDELEAQPAGLDDMGFDAAAHALVYGIQGLYAVVAALLDRAYGLREHYTEGLQLPPPLYTLDEARQAEQWARQFQADAGLRVARQGAQEHYQAPQPRKNARPAKRGRRT